MTIAKGIKQVMQIYHRHGFKIQNLHADGQLEHIKKYFLDMDININVTDRNEQVPAIEQTICTIKELVPAIVNQLPFKAYPHRMIVEMVYNVTFWLNAFPHIDGLMSLHTILTSSKIDHNKHCQLEFREYVQIHMNMSIHLWDIPLVPFPSDPWAIPKGHTIYSTSTQAVRSNVTIGQNFPCQRNHTDSAQTGGCL